MKANNKAEQKPQHIHLLQYIQALEAKIARLDLEHAKKGLTDC